MSRFLWFTVYNAWALTVMHFSVMQITLRRMNTSLATRPLLICGF